MARSMQGPGYACVLVLLFPSISFAGDFEQGVEALDEKDYELAVVSFTKAIKLGTDDEELLDKAKLRLKLYEKGEPYRQE